MAEPTKDQELRKAGQPSGTDTGAVDAQPETEKKPKKRFQIDIFRDWCKSCGICSAFCPKHCIRINEEGYPVVDEGDQCSGCGWCEVHCPDFAISVRELKAKKVSDMDELCDE